MEQSGKLVETELTKRERDLLACLVDYKCKHGGNSPTHGEMVRALGWRSTGDTYKYLRRLQALGLLAVDGRSIQIVGECWLPGTYAAQLLRGEG